MTLVGLVQLACKNEEIFVMHMTITVNGVSKDFRKKGIPQLITNPTAAE